MEVSTKGEHWNRIEPADEGREFLVNRDVGDARMNEISVPLLKAIGDANRKYDMSKSEARPKVLLRRNTKTTDYKNEV